MPDLAALVVKLSAETSQYSAAITKATEQMGGFADKVGDSVRDVAKDLLGLEALKKVFDFTENIVKTLASFDQLAHAVGATTEALSQLSFAGKLSGIDDIAVPLEKLAHSVGEVATGNQQLTDTFAALGVSIRDSGGKIKATDQQLLDIADAVSKYNDGLAKTAAVQAIFGRSGADFIKFLDQGAAGIKAAQQEAIDLGVSVSSASAQAADEFESNIARIGAAIQGVFFKALEEVLPVFQKITDAIIEFAKGAGNTQPIVEQLAAGFKIIGTVLVVIGTAFEVVGKVIGGVTALIGTQIRALYDLSTAFLHPIDSMKDFIQDQAEAVGIAKDLGSDIFGTLKAGATAATAVWGNLDDQLSEVHITAKKIKPDLVLIDQTQIKAIESAIEALAKLDDTLKQQVATYGLSGAAATVYDVTLGKLSASVDELNKKSPGEAKSALAELEKQGKLSKASIDAINAAIKAGIPIGDAFKTAIIEDATALERLKGVDALSKLDSQLLTMTGHLEEASKAAFDLANRPLQITIQTAQDKSAFAGLDATQKTAEATQQLNTLKQQAIAIEDALGQKIADVEAAAAAAGENNLKVAGEEAAARQAAIAQLNALYVKAQALADATGLKSAADQARALRDAIGSIQFNPKILEDVDKATEAQKRFNEALKEEKDANDDLALQMAALAKQNADGALTDLEYAGKQDEARQRAIDQLTAIQQQELEVIKNNPGNAQALDDYKKLGVQITELQTQMGQLAKTIRTDLTDSLSNAYVDFIDGSKSASAALRAFVADFTKEMLQLGSKALFQKLFDTTGISSGINSLFGAASKALPAAASATGDLASTTAAATSLSTAITTAATAGGTAMGTAVSTAATAGATELGTALGTAATAAATEMATAITTAGSAAAAEMAAAIAGAGAASGAGAAGAAAILAAAEGGSIPANQLTLVGEKGPELFVSERGTMIIGAKGPEYIKPTVSGFVVPNDDLTSKVSDVVSHQSNVIPFPADRIRLPSQYASLLTDAYLQKRQAGGPVSAGAPYLVGESGPELMVPDSNGTILPHSWAGGKGGLHVTNHFHITAPTGTVSRATQSQIAASTARSVQIANHRNN